MVGMNKRKNWNRLRGSGKNRPEYSSQRIEWPWKILMKTKIEIVEDIKLRKEILKTKQTQAQWEERRETTTLGETKWGDWMKCEDDSTFK